MNDNRRPIERVLAIGILGAGAIIGSVLLFYSITAPIDPTPRGTPLVDAASYEMPNDRIAQPRTTATTLVLHELGATRWADSNNTAEVTAIQMINTLGHFGPADHMPVTDYRRGQGKDYDLVVYVSTTTGIETPKPVLDDVLSGAFPVLWVGENVEQLAKIDKDFVKTYGWRITPGPNVASDNVIYESAFLLREERTSDIVPITIEDKQLVRVYGEAQSRGKPVGPWAVRSGHLSYISENPFDFQRRADRSLILADLLMDLLDPERPERHRALVRIEDVGPWADPDALRYLADILHERDVPFSVAVYPLWADPLANYGFGHEIRMTDRPEVADALRYMEEKGGTLLMHGLTHQFGDGPNPYKGTSGEDYEFFSAYIDENDNVRLEEPVPGDSTEWMQNRVQQSFAEFADAGLTSPTIFEFSHYAGSAVDYGAITNIFEARFEQGTYFVGQLSADEVTYPTESVTQLHPYAVLDIYGEYVIPENAGNIIPVGFNNNDAMTADDIIRNAENNLVVRDSVVGFFFHTFLDPGILEETVDGIAAAGYTFVSPDDILENWD